MELFKKSSSKQDQTDKQTLQYFNNVVKPIYSTLITNIVESKPEDILEFCIKWFQDQKNGQNKNIERDGSEAEDEPGRFETIDEELFRQIRQDRLLRGRKKRYGLSSEKSSRGSIKVQNGERKEQSSYMRILFFCMGSFLFSSFSEREIGELIQKMKKIRIQKDKQVCLEGEYGDRMFFVDQGIFQCVQQTQKGSKTVKNYYVGDTFGEICLLHMVRRQASIYCRSQQGVLFTLDRQSYIHYKKMSIIKKRTLYFCTLMKQEFFKSFSEEQLQKICDVLIEVKYEQGEIVINEGDVGTKFYIIIDGILVAYKQKQDNIVRCYKQGDAFGQKALVKDIPRQASVKALTKCRMVYMTRQVFKRIFENVDIQKQIDQKYTNRGNMIIKRRLDSDQIKQQKYQGRRGSIRPDKQNSSLLKMI